MKPQHDHGITTRGSKNRGTAIVIAKTEARRIDRCSLCKNILTCQDRCKAGLWVLCEQPDIADLERLQTLFMLPSVFRLFPMAYLVKLKTRIKNRPRFDRLNRMIDLVLTQ